MSLAHLIDCCDDADEQTPAQLRYDSDAFEEFGLSGDELAAFFGDCAQVDGAARLATRA